MRKFYLILITLFCTIAAQAWTVSFTNPEGWTAVAAYCFGGDAGEALGTWPGTVMTKDGDVWTVTCEGAEPEKIIFNNNNKGSQTANLDFVAGATYDNKGPVGAEVKQFTVYFDNTDSNWEEVYGYTWSPELVGAWPGKKLTKNAQGLYEFTIEGTSAPTMDGFKFNNGNGNGGESVNFTTFTPGQTYTATGELGSEPAPMDEWYVSIGGSFVEGAYEWNWSNGVNPVKGIADLGDFIIGTADFELKVWDGVADTYYGDMSTPIEAGESIWTPLTNGGGHMTVAGATETSAYNVKFNCNNNEICLTPMSSSIANIAADGAQAPAEYYNLQGIRVANPEGGVFIRIEGGQVTKVIR